MIFLYKIDNPCDLSFNLSRPALSSTVALLSLNVGCYRPSHLKHVLALLWRKWVNDPNERRKKTTVEVYKKTSRSSTCLQVKLFLSWWWLKWNLNPLLYLVMRSGKHNLVILFLISGQPQQVKEGSTSPSATI